MRVLNRSAYLGLKSATRQLVASLGGQDAAQEITRVGQKQISRYCAVDEEHLEQFIPIDIVADLTIEGKDASVLRALARLAGYEVVQLPQMPQGFAELQLAMGKTSKEVGEVFTRIGESLADGTFDKGERRATTDEINEAIGALVALRQVVEAG